MRTCSNLGVRAEAHSALVLILTPVLLGECKRLFVQGGQGCQRVRAAPNDDDGRMLVVHTNVIEDRLRCDSARASDVKHIWNQLFRTANEVRRVLLKALRTCTRLCALSRWALAWRLDLAVLLFHAQLLGRLNCHLALRSLLVCARLPRVVERDADRRGHRCRCRAVESPILHLVDGGTLSLASPTPSVFCLALCAKGARLVLANGAQIVLSFLRRESESLRLSKKNPRAVQGVCINYDFMSGQ